MTSSAEFSAWIMFIVAISDSRLLALAAQMPRHVFVDILEHRLDAGDFAFAQSAGGSGFSIGRAHPLHRIFLRGFRSRFPPFAQHNEMLLQAFDGIAQRPAFSFICRTISRGIVARGVT